MNVKGLMGNILRPGKDMSEKDITIRAEVVLQKKHLFGINDYSATLSDTLSEVVGQKVFMQLVSRDQIDHGTEMGMKGPRESLTWNPLDGPFAGDTKYKMKFKWNIEWGVPGALLVKNKHRGEFFLKSVTMSNVPGEGNLRFHCSSWIYPYSLSNKTERVFFSTQSYIPRKTPPGLIVLRNQELVLLRGNGTGERQVSDRIYDYDVYNDLGNPDRDLDLKRQVLGGSQDFPYPRRCRTGRGPTRKDRESESLPPLPTDQFFIPPDEKFPHINLFDYRANLLRALIKKAVPAIKSIFGNKFGSFKEVKAIYSKGISGPVASILELSRELVPLQVIKGLLNTQDQAIINFTVPQVIKADEKAWKTDKEFARQALSGVNPIVIKCLERFPPSSSLEANLYGPQESCITAEHIENYLDGLSVQQAVEERRLFILDYYDAYMPYIERINKQDDDLKMYASRTLFFLKRKGTLRVVAIELCLPPTSVSQAVRNVYCPALNGEQGALWLLAKAHARGNDSGYHQLVSHWLRTHAVIEPFIIATHRQLSKMHPLHKLLLPHFLSTMDINQAARQSLINAQGVIESSFTTGRYSIELSSKAYKQWRFNEQGLPADLLKRGVAVMDPTAPHGLRLAIEDYPYAVDGLEIWFSLKQWVGEYLSVYYKSDESIKEDKELQAWWTEVVNVGHSDLKKEESGWYSMESMEEVVEAITTLIWVASAHHAAVNFGQYAYGGFMPNLPTITRRLIPEKGSLDYAQIVSDPEAFFLKTVAKPSQATSVMAVLELLSKHAADEVYMGQAKGSTLEWNDDDGVQEAFSRFSAALIQVEKNVNARNVAPELKNRYGPAQVPYTLLYPGTSDVSNKGGLTGKGIPNSVSI